MVVPRQERLGQTAGSAIGTAIGDATITTTGGEGTTGTGETTETGGMTETGAKARRAPLAFKSSAKNRCSGRRQMYKAALRTTSVQLYWLHDSLRSSLSSIA